MFALSSPGLLINSTIFVLTNIINSTLITEAPPHAVACSIAISQTYNDSKWEQMSLSSNQLGGKRCTINLKNENPPEVLHYKIKYDIDNYGSYNAGSWQSILWKISSEDINKNETSLVNLKNLIKSSNIILYTFIITLCFILIINLVFTFLNFVVITRK
jgi:hypothetical protein